MIKEIGEREFIAKFYNLMAEVECGSHFDSDNPLHHEWLKKRISRYYYRGTKFLAYYLDDDTPVGFAGLLVEEPLDKVEIFGKMTELLDIGVFPSFRGKGYGNKLLKYVEDFSFNYGAYCIYTATYAKSYDLIAFYGKNGFVPVATLPDTHGPGDEGNVYMRKILGGKETGL